jgi:hypothetical protein
MNIFHPASIEAINSDVPSLTSSNTLYSASRHPDTARAKVALSASPRCSGAARTSRATRRRWCDRSRKDGAAFADSAMRVSAPHLVKETPIWGTALGAFSGTGRTGHGRSAGLSGRGPIFLRGRADLQACLVLQAHLLFCSREIQYDF